MDISRVCAAHQLGKMEDFTGLNVSFIVSVFYEPHCWLFSVPNCCIVIFLASSSLF